MVATTFVDEKKNRDENRNEGQREKSQRGERAWGEFARASLGMDVFDSSFRKFVSIIELHLWLWLKEEIDMFYVLARASLDE